MPVYRYKCSECGEFETEHGMNERLAICPSCGRPVKKLISKRLGIAFNGPGFYVTDNRPADSGSKGEGESSSSDSKAS